MKSDLNKPEVICLINDFGLEGYGLYHVLKLYFSPKKMNISTRIETLYEITKQYGASEYKTNKIIMGYGLFDTGYSVGGGLMVSLKRSEES